METLYGWEAVPVTRQTGLLDIHGRALDEQLDFPRHYKKQFTHAPGATVHGAPKYGARWANKVPHSRREMRRVARAKPIPYKVWGDRSLRRVDKLISKALAGMTPAQQEALIKEATARSVIQDGQDVS